MRCNRSAIFRVPSDTYSAPSQVTIHPTNQRPASHRSESHEDTRFSSWAFTMHDRSGSLARTPATVQCHVLLRWGAAIRASGIETNHVPSGFLAPSLLPRVSRALLNL